jgi:hypothetical protein
MKPTPEMLEEAKQYPNGWVYKIDGHFRPDENIPPEAIVGAWKVNAAGEIEGDFIENPRYQSKRNVRGTS